MAKKPNNNKISFFIVRVLNKELDSVWQKQCQFLQSGENGTYSPQKRIFAGRPSVFFGKGYKKTPGKISPTFDKVV